MTADFGPKPPLPAKIHVQLCEACGEKLKLADSAVIHRALPIAFCWPCAGSKEPARNDLHKAVVAYE